MKLDGFRLLIRRTIRYQLGAAAASINTAPAPRGCLNPKLSIQPDIRDRRPERKGKVELTIGHIYLQKNTPGQQSYRVNIEAQLLTEIPAFELLSERHLCGLKLPNNRAIRKEV